MWLALAIAVGLLAAVEVGARLCGLGQPVLYEKTDYGYRVVPGQQLRRFGHRVAYNDFGMRSEAAAPLPAPGMLRILCIGDSITFGSTSTDQELTYPYQLQAMLGQQGGNHYEVLNISAGGWAMENEEAWLAQHGLYGSHAVLLQVATHDIFQEKAGGEIVGQHPSFPASRPLFALQELATRYVLPRLRDPGEILYHHDHADVERTMASLERIAQLVRGQGAELFVLFVEQPRGYEPDDELTRYGKARLREKTQALGVPLILTAEAIDEAGGQRAFFDGLHPNELGNRVLAQQAAAALLAWQSRGTGTGAETRVAAMR